MIHIILHPQIGTLISRKCHYGWFLVILGGWCLLPTFLKTGLRHLGHFAMTVIWFLPCLDSIFQEISIPKSVLKSWILFLDRRFQVATGLLRLVKKHPCCLGSTPSFTTLELVRQWCRQPFYPLPPGARDGQEDTVFFSKQKSGLFIFCPEGFLFPGMIFFCKTTLAIFM